MPLMTDPLKYDSDTQLSTRVPNMRLGLGMTNAAHQLDIAGDFNQLLTQVQSATAFSAGLMATANTTPNTLPVYFPITLVDGSSVDADGTKLVSFAVSQTFSSDTTSGNAIGWRGVDFNFSAVRQVGTNSPPTMVGVHFDGFYTNNNGAAADTFILGQFDFGLLAGTLSVCTGLLFNPPVISAGAITNYIGIDFPSFGGRIPIRVLGATDSCFFNGGARFGGTSGLTAGIKMETTTGRASTGITFVSATTPTAARPITISGQAVREVFMERHTTSNTAGNSLTLTAGGATSAATDKAGGSLILAPGQNTGRGVSQVTIKGYVVATSSGTGDNTLVDRQVVGCFKALTNNTVTSLVNCTIASNTVVGGVLRYAVDVFDGTDLQVEEGVVAYQVTNKGGTLANNATLKFGNQQAVTSSALTVTFTITSASPAVIQVNANSTLPTPTGGYPRIVYSIDNLTSQAIAIQ